MGITQSTNNYVLANITLTSGKDKIHVFKNHKRNNLITVSTLTGSERYLFEFDNSASLEDIVEYTMNSLALLDSHDHIYVDAPGFPINNKKYTLDAIKDDISQNIKYLQNCSSMFLELSKLSK